MAASKSTPVKDDGAAAEAADAQVQSTVDKETEQGFRGVEVDPTPNENYTVQGVTSGAPVPSIAEARDVAAANTANDGRLGADQDA